MPVWEQRWHPLREEWVVVAAHRQNRPWTGETVRPPAADRRPAYDPGCYLCPGNARVARPRQPALRRHVRVRQRPSVRRRGGARARRPPPPPPYRVEPAAGRARVVCFSPRHDLTLAEMTPAAIADVIGVWRRETRDLAAEAGVRQVLCFENKGDVVGVSNPHPHGQIYATSFVWKTMETELAASARHLRRHRARPVRGHHPRRAERRPARPARGRPRDRVRPLLCPLRVRGLRRAQAARAARVRARRRGGRIAGARAVGGHHPLRQPVADVVSVRDGAAPGADQRRPQRGRQRVPLLHRVPSAAAAAATAQVPGGSGDRRRQLPGGHRARGEGRRAAGAARGSLRGVRHDRRPARLDRRPPRFLRARQRPPRAGRARARPTRRHGRHRRLLGIAGAGAAARRSRPGSAAQADDALGCDRHRDRRRHPTGRRHAGRRVSIPLAELLPPEPLDYARARALLTGDPARAWSAYVAGALVVLHRAARAAAAARRARADPIRGADRQGRQLVGGAGRRGVRGAGGAGRRRRRRPAAGAGGADGREPGGRRSVRRHGPDDRGVRPPRSPAGAAVPARRDRRPPAAAARRWRCSASTPASGTR